MLTKFEVNTLLLVERKPVIHTVAANFIEQKLDEISTLGKHPDAGAKVQTVRGSNDELSRIGHSFAYVEKTDRKVLRRFAAKEGILNDVCHIERYLKLIKSIPVLFKDGVEAVSILLRMSEEFNAFNASRKQTNCVKRTANKARTIQISQNMCKGLDWSAGDASGLNVLCA
jgi:hypothetical protein